MNTLSFERAWIAGVRHVLKNAALTSQIEIVGLFNPKVAAALDARWLVFDKEQIPKEGYSKIELATELRNIHLHLNVPLVATSLDLDSEMAHKFIVMKQGAKKKGKPARLLVKFRVQHAGNALWLIEWLMQYGSAEGQLTIAPKQQDLFEQPKQSTPADPNDVKRKRGRPRKQAPIEQEATETQAPYPIPSDPSAPEWRTADEIHSGVPHHVAVGQ